MTTIPPEGTLAGLLPPQGGGYHQHPTPNHNNGNNSHQQQNHNQQLPQHLSIGPGTSSVDTLYMSVPMKNARNTMTNGHNNGNLGIPITNGNGPHNPHIQGNFPRESWNRNSQGPYMVSLTLDAKVFV